MDLATRAWVYAWIAGEQGAAKTTLAKIIAGGMPGGAVAARKDILGLIDFDQPAGRERISHQGTQALGEGKMPEAKAYYQRALVVLGDPNPVTEELRKQFEGILKAMEQPLQKKPAPKK